MKKERVLSLIFSTGMALYFIYSFFYPRETGFWLLRNGFPILMLEFFSVFTVLLVADILKKKTGWVSKSKGNAKLGLLLILAMAFGVTYAFNVLLFFYFLLSTGIKFFECRSKKDMVSEAQQAGLSGAVFIASAFVSLVFGPLMKIFGTQISEYQLWGSIPGMSGAIVDNPGVLALWGFFYFTCMAAFSGINIRFPLRKSLGGA